MEKHQLCFDPINSQQPFGKTQVFFFTFTHRESLNFPFFIYTPFGFLLTTCLGQCLLHSDSLRRQEPYEVSRLKWAHLKATPGKEAWTFMLSLTQLLPVAFLWAWEYLSSFPRHSFSVRHYFSSSVDTHGHTRQNKQNLLPCVFSKSFLHPTPLDLSSMALL